MSNLELSDLPISYLRGHNELTQKFFKAIKDLDNKVVAQMLENNPHLIVTKNKNGLTPLLSAAKYNNEVAFKLLLDHNACVHATTKSGKSIIEVNY
jgi:ankyrin repeat protein